MTKTYDIYITLGTSGDQLEDLPSRSRVVELPLTAEPPVADEAETLAHPFINALAEANLTTADLRSRVLFVCGDNDPAAAVVAAYAFTSFLAGRRIDIRVGDVPGPVAAVDKGARGLEDEGIPEERAEVLAVGDEDADVELSLAQAPTPASVSALRYARRVNLSLPSDPMSALVSFVVVAGIRARGRKERLPNVIVDESPLELDSFRRLAAQFRRQEQMPPAEAIVEPLPRQERAAKLLEAAQLSPAATMLALGSTTPGGGLWHCPRPDRHTNGDANASMRVQETHVRCFRCDSEDVDPVRLTADVTGATFSDAAEWLMTTVAPRVDELLAQLPEEDETPAEDI